MALQALVAVASLLLIQDQRSVTVLFLISEKLFDSESSDANTTLLGNVVKLVASLLVATDICILTTSILEVYCFMVRES